MCLSTDPSGSPIGTLYWDVAVNGDVSIRYDQALSVNDNSYGVNIVDWPGSHKFTQLTGSDKAQLQFKNASGAVVFDFNLDYLTTKSGTPSGYASLGLSGGDGSLIQGSASWLLDWNTSEARNLNDTGLCSGGNCTVNGVNLLLDSPPTVSSTSYQVSDPAFSAWSFVNSYEALVSAAAFGAAGFGSVSVPLLHNSPSKLGYNAQTPVPCTGVCGDGVVDAGEQCDDGNTANGDCCSSACQLEPTTTQCRASAGACDAAEFCTGSSGTCPADAKSTAVCRPAANECDVAESCNGVSNDCPANASAPNGMSCTSDGNACTVDVCSSGSCTHAAGNVGTVCRAAAGACDVAETCTGSSPTCPADAKSTAVCRPAASDCDVAEVCNGSSNDCPANGSAPNGMTCTSDGNACTADVCSSGSCTHAAGNAGAVCRASTGACDVAEVCTGSSTACPADGFVAGGTVCRNSLGVCDLAETCTGSSPACPADAKSTALCRPAAGECDAAESCNGVDAGCPADASLPDGASCTGDGNACTADVCQSGSCMHPANHAGTVCRASTGACDVAETCNGTSAACPVDGLVAPGTVCRASAGACDVAEACSGTSATCPADTFVVAGSVCRAAAGACDVAESCSGSGASCPVDAKSTAVCRAASGACDAAETCNGTSNDCPADGLASSSVVCRPGAGDCDVAETCTGTSASCPADAPGPNGMACSGDGNACTADVCSGGVCTHAPGNAGAVCRASAGACDVAESCTGTSATCPADGFVAGGTVCRNSLGVCDLAETCSGTSAPCPADGFVAAGATCRASAGACDVAESCTGSSASCPGDTKSTAVCRPSAGACDVAESCNGVSNDCPANAPLPGGTVCRASTGQCDVAEACSGASASCPADAKAPEGTVCSDEDACTVNDQCVSGLCAGTGPSCGNGALECGEVCDDGNTANGDGCSSTCDVEVGENCGDGTDNDGDGKIDCADDACVCQAILNVCSHPCLSSLLFKRGLDYVHVQGAIVPTTPIDPSNEELTLLITNANGVVFSATLAAGALQETIDSGLWQFKSRTAAKLGGMAKVRIQEDGAAGPGGYRVSIKAYGELTGATLPTMTVQIMIGNDVFADTDVWAQLRRGWRTQLD